MIDISHAIPVNDDPAAPPLDRDQLWRALVRKAEDPVPFVPAIRACRVLARGEEDGRAWLEREARVRGEVLRERVTFHPQERVHFLRLSGRARGTIENLIEVDEAGALVLRFRFRLTIAGLLPGSPEKAAHAAALEASYLEAVRATLAEARRRALAGAL